MRDKNGNEWSATSTPAGVTICRGSDILGAFKAADAARLGRALVLAAELTKPEGKRNAARIIGTAIDELFGTAERFTDDDDNG